MRFDDKRKQAEFEKKKYDYWLTAAHEVANEKRTKLVKLLGSAKEVYNANENTLINTGIVNLKDIAVLEGAKTGNNFGDFEACMDKGIELVTVMDREYPRLLKKINDAPYGFFMKGKLPPKKKKCVAIVGARGCTAYGRCAAEDIAKTLGNLGVPIVSGLARGIDGAAHSGAIRARVNTIGVLGCGIDVVYPTEHKNLFKGVEECGALVSEYVPKTAPNPRFFPLRNRIISGLSSAVIVIEARERSGSLITADLALEQGRDVFALPGRINDPLSMGCNNLIREGAGIVNSIEDLVTTFRDCGIINDDEDGNKSERVGIYKLRGHQKLIYDFLEYSPIGLDEIIQTLGLEIQTVISTIENLLDKGVIREEGKNRYVKARL